MSRLSGEDADLLVAQLADLTTAGIPLGEGLRAAADEASSRRLRDSLRQLAAAVDSGKPLDQALNDPRLHLPKHISGLIAAATRAGRLGPALAELIEQKRAERERWRSIVAALAYPTFVFVFAAMIFVCFHKFVVSEFRVILDEFGLTLPLVTKMMFQISEIGLTGLLGLIPMLLVIVLAVRFGAGAARWRRVLATVPLIGPLWYWSAVAQWSRLLALLVDQELPLPAALRSAADGVEDANVRQVSQMLADQISAGRSLSQAIEASERLPLLMVPLVSWGERSGSLPESLRTVADMYESRVRMRTGLVRTVAPPLLFLGVIGSIVPMTLALFVPLISLIQSLS